MDIGFDVGVGLGSATLGVATAFGDAGAPLLGAGTGLAVTVGVIVGNGDVAIDGDGLVIACDCGRCPQDTITINRIKTTAAMMAIVLFLILSSNLLCNVHLDTLLWLRTCKTLGLLHAESASFLPPAAKQAILLPSHEPS